LHRSQMHDRGRPPSGRSNAKLGTAADVGIKRTRSITELVVVLVVVLVLFVLAGWLLVGCWLVAYIGKAGTYAEVRI